MISRTMPLSAAEGAGFEPAPRPLARLTRDMVRLRDDAWTEFHVRYFARLFRYALTLHRGDRAAAEDSVQSGFLRAVRHIRRFDCEDAFWFWLTLLVRCAAADQGRKLAARSRLHDALLDVHWIGGSGSCAPKPQQMTLVFLEEAVAQLPERDRQLLEEKYAVGRSTSELAERYRQTEKAVECRLRRLRKRLKSKIDALSKQTCP